MLDSTAYANRHIASLWFEAFNEHNLVKLLDLYHEDAAHYSPKLKIRQPQTNGFIKGKTALKSWWQDAFERLPTLQYQVLKIISDEDLVFMEYLRKTKGEEDMVVGEVLQIENGLIVASRVYHS